MAIRLTTYEHAKDIPELPGTALTKKKWNEIKLNIESVLQA